MDTGHEQLDAFGIAWRLGATLFFVLLNGFFVAAEFALVKIRGSRVDALVTEERRGAKTVRHIHAHLDHYLSACQLGITLASLILGALGEPAVSVLIIAAAGVLGLDVDASASWLPLVSIALAFAVITTLHMTIGEQAPKMWAIRRAEGMALRTASTLRAFAWLFAPFIAVINSISNGLLRTIGLPGDGHHEEATDHEGEAGDAAEPTVDLARGKRIAYETCASCHGQDLQGMPNNGKSLITSEFVAQKSDKDLLAFLKVGRQPFDPLNTTGVAMPPRDAVYAVTSIRAVP